MTPPVNERQRRETRLAKRAVKLVGNVKLDRAMVGVLLVSTSQTIAPPITTMGRYGGSRRSCFQTGMVSTDDRPVAMHAYAGILGVVQGFNGFGGDYLV